MTAAIAAVALLALLASRPRSRRLLLAAGAAAALASGGIGALASCDVAGADVDAGPKGDAGCCLPTACPRAEPLCCEQPDALPACAADVDAGP